MEVVESRIGKFVLMYYLSLKFQTASRERSLTENSTINPSASNTNHRPRTRTACLVIDVQFVTAVCCIVQYTAI